MIPVYHEMVYIRVYLVDTVNPVRIEAVLDVLTYDMLFFIRLFC